MALAAAGATFPQVATRRRPRTWLADGPGAAARPARSHRERRAGASLLSNACWPARPLHRRQRGERCGRCDPAAAAFAHGASAGHGRPTLRRALDTAARTIFKTRSPPPVSRCASADVSRRVATRGASDGPAADQGDEAPRERHRAAFGPLHALSEAALMPPHSRTLCWLAASRKRGLIASPGTRLAALIHRPWGVV